MWHNVSLLLKSSKQNLCDQRSVSLQLQGIHVYKLTIEDKKNLYNTFQCLVKVSNRFFENPWMANLASTMAFQGFSMLPYLACWSIRLIAHKDVAITIVFTHLFVYTFAFSKCHLLHHTHAIWNPNNLAWHGLTPCCICWNNFNTFLLATFHYHKFQNQDSPRYHITHMHPFPLNMLSTKVFQVFTLAYLWSRILLPIWTLAS